MFDLDQPGHCRVDVFDVTGRRIRAVTSAEFLAGVNSVEWDGRAEDGRSVAPGVYWVRLQSAGQVMSGKIVVLR
jgi:flagellar hook assembly protein FlgD